MEYEEIKDKKPAKKEKILVFVIGVLVGAVVSTAAFFIYINVSGVSVGSSSSQMAGGTPPEMPNGENGQGGQGGTPPEKPSGDNSENGQGGTPPEKPSDDDGGTPPEKPSDDSQNSEK